MIIDKIISKVVDLHSSCLRATSFILTDFLKKKDKIRLDIFKENFFVSFS